MTERARLVRRPSIRVRLALWSTGGLLVVMLVAGVATTAGLRNGLRDRAHESLSVPFHVIGVELATEPDLRLTEVLDSGLPRGGHNEVIGQVLDARGDVIDSSGQPATTAPMVGPAELVAATRDGEWHEPRQLPGRTSDDIVVVVPIGSGPRAGTFVVLAQTLAPADAEVDRQIRLFLTLAPAVLITSFLGGWWITRASLRPVDLLTRKAALIDPELSDATLPVPRGDDEVSRLALALNEMLDRLRREIERQRRFSADASHELRTPLALMTTSLDVALRSTTIPDDARPVLESLREDAARLSRILEDLLVLSRAEAAGQVELATAEVDLLDLAVAVAAKFRGAADARGIAIEVSGAPVIAAVDAHLLSQALANLVDNALKFSHAGNRIDITVAGDGSPTIAVADQGEGIPPGQQDRVFERFHQLDPARRTGGAGLGLAIVRSIVRAHGGTVDVDSEPGRGSTFTIRLPPGRSTPEG